MATLRHGLPPGGPVSRLLPLFCLVSAVLAAVIILGGVLTGEADGDAEERRLGLHCLSDDDDHEGMETLIKRRLNDPSSMETLSTRIGAVQADQTHLLYIDFTAKNAVGRRVHYTAFGIVDHATCKATIQHVGP